MPITLSSINIARAVTAALDDYRNKLGQFVADYVAPVVDAPERSGYMPKFQNTHMQIQDYSVTLDGPAHKVDIGTTNTAYNCVDHSAEAHLTNRMIKSDTSGLLKAGNLATLVDEGMRLQRENEVAVALLAVSSTSAPTTKWNVSGGSAPKDIATKQATIHGLINRIHEYGLCTVDVGLELRVLCGLANGRQTSDLPNMETVAAWLGLKELRMAYASYDSTKPGKTTSFSTLFSTKGFWLFHKPEVMDSSLPCFMATPRFAELSQPRVYPLAQPEGFGIEVNDCYDLVSVDGNACHYFTAVI
jgi:hypothetical protein